MAYEARIHTNTLSDRSETFDVIVTPDAGAPIRIGAYDENGATFIMDTLKTSASCVEVLDDRDVTVRVEKVYGRDVIRPIGRNAELLARLAGTKTLTRDALEFARALGFTVREDLTPRLEAVQS